MALRGENATRRRITMSSIDRLGEISFENEEDLPSLPHGTDVRRQLNQHTGRILSNQDATRRISYNPDNINGAMENLQITRSRSDTGAVITHQNQDNIHQQSQVGNPSSRPSSPSSSSTGSSRSSSPSR